MNQEAKSLTVTLLDKEFRIQCAPGDEHELLESAEYLNQKLLEIRNSGKLIGLDKIALMAAMNISHELVQAKSQLEQKGEVLDKRLALLQDKVKNAISRNASTVKL